VPHRGRQAAPRDGRRGGLRAGGAYDLLASIVVLDHRYRPGDEQSVVGMVHRPLEVQVRPLATGPAAAPAAVPPTCPSPPTKRATAWPAPADPQGVRPEFSAGPWSVTAVLTHAAAFAFSTGDLARS